ncbi:AcrR family transcriptional regulator [Microbacteriaceae bacterium SG_E_30_P1]|uniref:AcrR family transcriptional regulator n=1 Tax=Antiquaquibacter oligotrophicus TaxID=2880260 RepID=A0ABT6KMF0_9MICO|nr:TetR/AcrR family transcriptional regulator [Antiquaquibacter oligotrophicus]MDH6181186.1 AcrR family transcriptional regulator [Antiquaquibacter oligotrophicus]UDF13119.1 TetR/AcrR family transcriptional regulator [Antiquaquibacter oligotrophicus]
MGLSRVDDRIYRAALDLLRTRGPHAVSMESVAVASGVAKTTLYRRFDNREALLSAAVASASIPISLPADLDAQQTLRWTLRHSRDAIENVIGRGTLAAMMSANDPDQSASLLGIARTSIEPLRAGLHTLVERGELRSDLDVELTLTILMGAVISELIRGRPTDDDWVERVLDLLWPGLAPRQ